MNKQATTLHRFAFDGDVDAVRMWLIGVVGAFPEKDAWLLLEQMHRFDFAGPDAGAIAALLVPPTVEDYGLRGRLFCTGGQVEWRRLGPRRARCVALWDGIPPFEPLLDVEIRRSQDEASREETRLILWGTSKGDGLFRELRVGRGAAMPYPDALRRNAAGQGGERYAVLSIREYRDFETDEGISWRFLPPHICAEDDLKTPQNTFKMRKEPIRV